MDMVSCAGFVCMIGGIDDGESSTVIVVDCCYSLKVCMILWFCGVGW